MFDVAADLKMPEEWVELRHQFTHGGELPGLEPLDVAVEGALSWLWDAFWSRFGDTAEQDTEADLKRKRLQKNDDIAKIESLQNDIRIVLKKFVSARKIELQKTAVSGSATAGADQLVDMLTRKPESLPSLMSLLVTEREMIVPSNRSVKESMAGAYAIWDTLLIRLSDSIRPFLVAFVLAMTKKLIAVLAVDDSQDPVKEAFMLWIIHVFTSDDWAARRARSMDGTRELRRIVTVECILNAGPWTDNLSQELSGKSDSGPSGSWVTIQDAAKLRPLEINGERGGTSGVEETGNDSNARDSSAISGFASKDYSGWKKWPGKWRPVPIGMVDGEVVS